MARWFRFYNETLDDPKAQKLAPPLFKHWVNLLCLAARNDGYLPSPADCAFALRVTEPVAEQTLRTLQDAGLIDVTETGMEPHNWRSRQHISDVSTERVKRYRQRSAKRDETVSVTPPDTETDTETDSVPTERAQAPSLSDPPFALTPEEAPKTPDPAKPPKSPLDVKADFWAAGKAYLGKHAKNPGALIGRWCRDYTNGAVMDALAKAAAEAPADPVSFIERILRGPNGKRTDKPDSHAAVRAAHAAASGGRPAEPGYLDPFAPVGPGPQAGEGSGGPVVDLASADFRSVDHGSTGRAGACVLGGRGPDGMDGEVQGLSGGAARVSARLAG